MFGFPPLPENEKTKYTQMTGLNNAFTILQQDHPSHFLNYRKWLATPAARKAIHVGTRNLDFGATKTTVFTKLAEDIPKSARIELEELLNAGYAVLLYGCQFDATVPPAAVDKLIKTCNGWNRLPEFLQNTKKEIWRVNGEVAGWRKTCLNLSQYFIRNAGHMGITDQPEWMLDMINQFTRHQQPKTQTKK
jgi:carboxypeptidase C (cathepsin A)